jgi:hypothetical protein
MLLNVAKKIVPFAKLISSATAFLCFLHSTLKIMSTLVRHRHVSSWFTDQAFGFSLVATVSVPMNT